MSNSLRSHEVRPSKALKLTRLSVCLPGGRGVGYGCAVPRPCISPAVQLGAVLDGGLRASC